MIATTINKQHYATPDNTLAINVVVIVMRKTIIDMN